MSFSLDHSFKKLEKVIIEDKLNTCPCLNLVNFSCLMCHKFTKCVFVHLQCLMRTHMRRSSVLQNDGHIQARDALSLS